MPNFSPLPNVFAWQREGRWFYVENQAQAPGDAVEMRRFDDGQETLLSVSRGTKGVFIRGAKPIEPRGQRQGG